MRVNRDNIPLEKGPFQKETGIAYNISINRDRREGKIDLKIKPIIINIKKYNLKFPVDGMF